MRQYYSIYLVTLLLVCVLGLVAVRHWNGHQGNVQLNSWVTSYSPLQDKIIAGRIPGLMADFKVLDVFAIYYDASMGHNAESLNFLPIYLKRAQQLDPRFFDVYRLASSILAYDAHQPHAAISLLKQGIRERPDVWEFAFFAGFIAYDLLQNKEMAYELLSQVVHRENTPLFIITLASRFLQSAATPQDAITFLRGMLKTVPKEYQEGIKNRIQELESEAMHEERMPKEKSQ